jgi:tetratricopeptide (TPR) repeat protein
MAGDKALHAEALSYLGYTYLYCHPPRPQKSIEILREALRELADADNLVRSDICIGLAYAYALINNESQAKEAIHLAQDGFPSHPEQCDSFFYADIARDTFYRWEAKIYLDLAQHGQQQEYYQHAWHLLEQSARTEARSERSSLATVIYQSAAALGMGNLELYEAYMRKGLVLAKEMGSQRRLMEAYTIAQNTPPTWSSDQRVKELEEEFFVPLRLKGMQSGTP